MEKLGAVDLIWAVALLAYIAVYAQRNLSHETLTWKLRTAGVWVLIFAGVFVVASHLNLRLP